MGDNSTRKPVKFDSGLSREEFEAYIRFVGSSFFLMIYTYSEEMIFLFKMMLLDDKITELNK